MALYDTIWHYGMGIYWYTLLYKVIFFLLQYTISFNLHFRIFDGLGTYDIQYVQYVAERYYIYNLVQWLFIYFIWYSNT